MNFENESLSVDYITLNFLIVIIDLIVILVMKK
jgi:hypothetical protein